MFKVKTTCKMGEQQWLGFILLSFVWIILLEQVHSRRLLLQTPTTIANPWLHLPNILPPMNQTNIPKFNFSLPPISLSQLSLPQSQPPRVSLMPNIRGSIPPSTLPTWPTFNIPPLPSFAWNNPSPPPPSFPWTTPSPPLFPWSIPSPPLQNNPTFPWLTPSPPPPNAQTFPLINVTNPLPTIPSLPWNFSSPPPNSPLFPWIIPSPPLQSFPWNNPSPPPPFLNFPWLNLSPPPIGVISPLPSFGLPPSNPLFPTGIQFTFSNFTQSWLPEAGVKVTWQSTISVELSLQLLAQALIKPITLIISAIQGTQNDPGTWSLSSGFIDNKLDTNIGAFCTKSGKDGYPVKGIVVTQTPIDDGVSSAITWFTILFNGWSKDVPPKATLDHTLGAFGAFVTNTTTTNLKIFCSHPISLNRIAAKQGQYVLN